MNKHFIAGFEKVAIDTKMLKAIGAGALAVAGIGGLGAFSGNQAHVMQKLMHARTGKDYKPQGYAQNNPKMSGALTLGLWPSIELMNSQRDLDEENSKVQDVFKQHPIALAGMS